MQKVTITIKLNVEEVKPDQLRYLLSDALAEFQHPRRDAEAYVAQRYPDGLPRKDKVQEVAGRVELAERLRRATLGADITLSEVIDHPDRCIYVVDGQPKFCPQMRTSHFGTRYHCNLFRPDAQLLDENGEPSGPGFLQRWPECKELEELEVTPG